jgi:hypothetical protein
MKNMNTLGIALLALFIISVVASSTASAVTFLLAEWLDDGQPIVTPQLADWEKELTIVNLDGGGLGITVEILCSEILDGTVGPGSIDSITAVLNLSGEEISGAALTGLGLVCTNSKNCTEPLVWGEELPEKSEAELMEAGSEVFFADLQFNVSFYAECLIAGISAAELCNAPTVASNSTNEANGTVDEVFSDAFQELAGLKLGECGGHAETAEITGLEICLLWSGDELDISSDD